MAIRDKSIFFGGLISDNMKNLNKQIIIGAVVLLSIAGISRASFLSQYGTITGTANVSAPEFYIGSAETETLLINEKPSSCYEPFKIARIYRTFKTRDLGGVNFNYVPKVEFSVRAKVSTTTPQNLILNFGYYDVSGGTHYLCSAIATVDNEMKNYTSSLGQCNEKPTNVKRFFYEFQKGCEDCDYTISKCASGFYTKIRLSR